MVDVKFSLQKNSRKYPMPSAYRQGREGHRLLWPLVGMAYDDLLGEGWLSHRRFGLALNCDAYFYVW